MATANFISFILIVPDIVSSISTEKLTDIKNANNEIINLSQYLNPLSDKGCLTVVDNLVGIEIPSIDFSIILRTPFNPNRIDPSSRHTECSNFTTKHAKQNKLPSKRLCFIHPINLVFESRPWKCQVHFSIPLMLNKLLQPVKHKRLELIQVFKVFSDFEFLENGKNLNFNRQKGILPSSQSSLLIILSTESPLSYPLADELIPILSQNLANDVINQIHVYLHFKVNLDTTGKLRCAIGSVSVFCTQCVFTVNQDQKKFKSVSREQYERFILQLENFGAFPGNEEILQWSFLLYGFYAKFTREVTKCRKLSPGQRPQYIFDVRDVNEKLARAQAYVWVSIMINYTFITDIETMCLNGRNYGVFRHIPSTLSTRIELDGLITGKIAPYQFSLTFENHINTIQFITCGNRGMSLLPFIELVAVYDPVVWIALLVTLTCFVGFLKRVWKNMSLQVIINITKLLLEQGNPFPPPFFKNSSCRIMFGTLGLATLILSNGYKNENVYRILASRIPITYDTLSDLLRDGFSLYSRSGSSMSLLFHIETPMKWIFQPLVVRTDDSNVYVLSELAGLTSAIQTKKDSLIFNNSVWSRDIQSKIPQIVSHVYNLSKILRVYILDELYFSEIVQNRVKIVEEIFLLDKIRKCNKTAVILPRDAAMRYALQLSKPNVSSTIPGRVNIGKEKYFEQYYAFRLSGFLNPTVIRRVKTLQTSGVLNWWESVIREGFERKHYVDSRVLPIRPKMNGNVLVIFAVWLGGLTMALALWIFEVKLGIWKTVCYVSRCIKFVCMFFLTSLPNYALYCVKRFCNLI